VVPDREPNTPLITALVAEARQLARELDQPSPMPVNQTGATTDAPPPARKPKSKTRCHCPGSIVRFANWHRQIFLDSGILFRFKDS
jgi:hypothetical protein